MAAIAGLALLAAQVAVGAIDAVLGAPAVLADVHLALASALWAVVVGVVTTSALAPPAPTSARSVR